MSAGDFRFRAAAYIAFIDVAATGQLSRRRLSRAMEFMYANLARCVHVADVAGAVGLSAFHFARAFKRTTGMTPYRFLVTARVERVKELLRESEACLAEIAKQAGFVDQSHMNNVFKRSTGVTPKAFRSVRMPVPSTPERAGATGGLSSRKRDTGFVRKATPSMRKENR